MSIYFNANNNFVTSYLANLVLSKSYPSSLLPFIPSILAVQPNGAVTSTTMLSSVINTTYSTTSTLLFTGTSSFVVWLCFHISLNGTDYYGFLHFASSYLAGVAHNILYNITSNLSCYGSGSSDQLRYTLSSGNYVYITVDTSNNLSISSSSSLISTINASCTILLHS